MRMLIAVVALAWAGAGFSGVVLIDISAGGELSLERAGAATPAEIGASLEPTDVLKAAGPCQATLLYDESGAATLDFAEGQLEKPVGAKPAAPSASLAGAVGKSLTAAFGAAPAPAEAPRGAVEAGYILGRLSVDDVPARQPQQGAPPPSGATGDTEGLAAQMEPADGSSKPSTLRKSTAPEPTLAGDPALPGLPEVDELSRLRYRPGATAGELEARVARLAGQPPKLAIAFTAHDLQVTVTPEGGASWSLSFEKLDDAKFAKVIGLAAKLTAGDAPPGARLALARWLESKGLAYAALFEYRNALRARLVEGKVPPAYRGVARHVAALALVLGDRDTARAIATALAP